VGVRVGVMVGFVVGGCSIVVGVEVVGVRVSVIDVGVSVVVGVVKVEVSVGVGVIDVGIVGVEVGGGFVEVGVVGVGVGVGFRFLVVGADRVGVDPPRFKVASEHECQLNCQYSLHRLNANYTRRCRHEEYLYGSGVIDAGTVQQNIVERIAWSVPHLVPYTPRVAGSTVKVGQENDPSRRMLPGRTKIGQRYRLKSKSQRWDKGHHHNQHRVPMARHSL
jgi:hypothetical protein